MPSDKEDWNDLPKASKITVVVMCAWALFMFVALSYSILTLDPVTVWFFYFYAVYFAWRLWKNNWQVWW
jgi:hypothetical protein